MSCSLDVKKPQETDLGPWGIRTGFDLTSGLGFPVRTSSQCVYSNFLNVDLGCSRAFRGCFRAIGVNHLPILDGGECGTRMLVRCSPQEFPRPDRPLHPNILAYKEQNDVAAGQSPRCLRAISLDNLPRIGKGCPEDPYRYFKG